MLDIVTPFNYRNHTGKWILVANDGWVAFKDADGRLSSLSEPQDPRAHLTVAEIDDLVKAHSREYGAVQLCASPAPGQIGA